MRVVFGILKKELRRWSTMNIFYILFALLIFGIGIFTWFFNVGETTFNIDQIMFGAFTAIYWGLAIATPILATGTILEEKRIQALEFLLVKPVSIAQFVIGKLLAIVVVLFIFLLLTLPYYISIVNVTKIPIGYLFWIYVFLFFVGIVYSLVSMAVASFFKTYWRSYLWSYFIIFFIHIGATFLGNLSFYGVHEVFIYIELQSHFSYFLSGGVALSTFIYLFSLLVVGLFVTIYKLSRDNL